MAEIARAPGRAGGLSSASAAACLAEVGPNEITRAAATPVWVTLRAQFGSPLILLLIAACAISAFLGELADAIAIGVIVVLNALVGFFQEYRAERAILALRSMTAPRARVVRDEHPTVVAAAQVVPGDTLLLEAGDIVAADARLTAAHALATNEASLTGESATAAKSTAPTGPETPLAERHDFVFMGTAVATGTGEAEVVATGMRTELGKIAHLLSTVQSQDTPLQQRLARVGSMLLYLCLGIVVVTAAFGLARHQPLFDVFMSAISLAVAAVPEGLPAIVTIALAVGVQRMAARHVLVRHLPAVETLGSATVVCTDKTGTLTTGVMTVRELWAQDERALIDAAAACCDATLGKEGTDGTGDPTELAILVAAHARGISRADIETQRPRTNVHPFDADRKRMSVRRRDGVLYVKGAFESIEPLCQAGLDGAAQGTAALANRGLRVLAVAVGASDDERALTLVGLIGIADPPRPEAIAAVAAAKAAGLRTVMITGDHPATARAIAREMGIVDAGDEVGESVHARATPEDKLNIVRAWKARGAVVAMTGDGVNDAPALREAQIGIAMGKTGTEVTREASDMVLADDNFASIIAAIEEGRGIFDNIRKTLIYLLGGNTGELLVMLGAGIAGLPLPLLPLHLLWINLATDGLPALALVMEPRDPDVMRRPPRPAAEPILGRAEWANILLTGFLQGAVTLAVFLWGLRARSLPAARDLAFSTLVFGELFRSFASRSRTRTLWQLGPFTNARLLAVVALSTVAQVGIHFVPATRRLFQFAAPNVHELALSFAAGLVVVTVLEASKLRWHPRSRAER
ncbi:MAG TPA: cation-translocating P-type ATPase [Polyangia bacterium]